MTAKEVHAHQLATITAAVEHAREFEHLHHLGSRASRKAAASALHALRNWHAITSADDPASVSGVVVEALAAAGSRADTPDTPPSAQELP